MGELVEIDPVDIIHQRDHPFKTKPSKVQGGKPAPGCGVCNRAKTNMAHVGSTKSLNVTGAHMNYHAYDTIKRAWQDRLIELLERTDLPKGLEKVEARGLMCFAHSTVPDQGNHRYMIEKALGDALQLGGWLADDDWHHYKFGELDYAYEKGRSWTALTLFPSVLA